MRATWSWRSTTPTRTVTRRLTSPRSRCWGGDSAPASAASKSNASTASTSGDNYGPLGGLVSRANRTIDLQVVVEQWDRMGQFYASLERGHTTALAQGIGWLA